MSGDTPTNWSGVVGPDISRLRAWDDIAWTLERDHFIFPSNAHLLSKQTIADLRKGGLPSVICDLLGRSKSIDFRKSPRSWNALLGEDITRGKGWDAIKSRLERKLLVFPSVVPHLSDSEFEVLRRSEIPSAICDVMRAFTCAATVIEEVKPETGKYSVLEILNRDDVETPDAAQD